MTYTHWFAPDICFGMYAEKCVIIKTRGGLLGKLFGKHKVRTCEGYTGWASDQELYFIEED